MLISIVIPNFNGKELLEKNLPKILEVIEKESKKEIEIIVVDDGSTDGSVEMLRRLVKDGPSGKARPLIKLVVNKKNLGFSSAVNRGVKKARGEIVILLNTDTYPKKGFLEAVLPHFNDPKVFAVGMLDKSIEGYKIVRRGRGVGGWEKGFLIHRRGEINKKDTFWVSGGSGAFRRNLFLELGGFDEVYNPFYWEDIDLCFRAKKRGYKLIFEPKAVVIHEHQKGIIKSSFGQDYIRLISYRNQILFVWKNANFSQLINHFFWLPYHLIKTLIGGDIYLFLGLLWAIPRFLKYKK